MLHRFKTIRVDQAERLLQMIDPKCKAISALRALQNGGRVRIYGPYVTLQDDTVEPEAVELLDVALLLEPDEPWMIQKSEFPIAVSVYKRHTDGKLWRYDLCRVKSGQEDILPTMVSVADTGYRVVVFILDHPQQCERILVPFNHMVTWRDGKSYQFYEGRCQSEKGACLDKPE